MNIIGAALLVTMVVTSLLFGLFVVSFNDKSKLTNVERNSFYYWNKKLLYKSFPEKQADKAWFLSQLQKYSFIAVILYVLVNLVL